MIARHPLTAIFFCAALAIPPVAAGSGIEHDIPVVLTPVRLVQPRSEVPASVSVLDRELIQATGIRELPEILRLVPGMAVAARDGWQHVASYHGTSYKDSRRMQVLVDGRSVYQAGLATIDWNDIPLAIEDIERIEVVRGPNTAAYGANAMLGIINIITRHPEDSPRARVKISAGRNGVEDYLASASHSGRHGSLRLTAGERQDRGFDRRADGSQRRDSKNLQYLNVRWLHAPDEQWQLEWQAGYKTGRYLEDTPEPEWVTESLPPITTESPPDLNVKDYFSSFGASYFVSATNSVKLQLDFARQRERIEWQTCLPALFLGFPDTSVICGQTSDNARNQRIDLDLQHTMLGQQPWKLVYGLHAKHAVVDSSTFFNGRVERESYQLFANAEYRFHEQWSATLGGSQEYHSGLGENFSPRIALLFLPSRNHSFRVVWSEAVRTPDLFETDARWSYRATGLRERDTGAPYLADTGQFQLQAVSPDGLREERIRSRELGYYGSWWQRRLEVDLKLFRDDMDDLISKQLAFSGFSPTNSAWVEQRGFEAELELRPNPALRLRTTYARIESESNSHSEEDLTARHSGSAGAIYTAHPWQLAGFIYHASAMNNREFSRLDLQISRTLRLGEAALTLRGVAQHFFNNAEGELFGDNRYDDATRAYLSLELNY